VQQVQDAVEPAEVAGAGAGFEGGPGEDADGDEADAGLLHEAYVVVPGLRRPLLGVVVAAEEQPSAGRRAEARCGHRFLLPGAVVTSERFIP
jgi:hypothetical protein